MPDPAGDSGARALALADLCTHLQEHAELEKAALAHRLHDELGGLLTAAKMDLSWLQPRIAEPVLQKRLSQLGAVLDEAMDLKRRVVEELRPSLLEHFGLPTALRAHVEAVCAAAGLECEVAMEDNACETLPKATAIALFRVVQAGLENVVRHAQARKVRIELRDEGGHLVLSLSDDGRGFDVAGRTSTGHGLATIRHRIDSLGGRFTAAAAAGGGTALTVALPARAS